MAKIVIVDLFRDMETEDQVLRVFEDKPGLDVALAEFVQADRSDKLCRGDFDKFMSDNGFEPLEFRRATLPD